MTPRGCLLLPLVFIASAGVVLVGAECGDIRNETYCEIDPALSCLDCHISGSLVPNPSDCSSYYMCKSGSEFLYEDPLLCPDGEIFDQTELKCKADGECMPYCDQSSCFYTCEGNPDGMIADPFDCSVYRQCDYINPGLTSVCPADTPYFDGEECGTDQSACCHCRPYCYADDVDKKVGDPTDCRKYFVCLAAHEIPTIQSECAAGEHFSEHAGECSSTAPCVTLCRNVVDENGCIEPYTCQETGFFPICKTQCRPDYYHCLNVSDDYASTETCSDELVFNPDTLQCTNKESCPYSHN